MDTTISIDDFEQLLHEEGLPDDALATVTAILSEIRPAAQSFRANSGELLALAVSHSATFKQLSENRQAFFASVLNMPLFFYSGE
ncbi:hypothetical protein [Citrobacter koseri]|uniref:hypothetical protein n=1 Tax=Citrobacter koseri TaxID=545 RepID=UPI001F38B40E|nr:hypothetical protein [Citrobacter koseri]